ncbi:hypothetical protein ABPG72_022406 [Tetrahymena utriculariae]
MNNNDLNDSISSYSEGTPIVNKIDQNFDLLGQFNLNSVASGHKIERKQSKLDNEVQTFHSQKTIKYEKKQTIQIANEETLILPNSKKPIRLYTIFEQDKILNTESQDQSIVLKEINELRLSKFAKSQINGYDSNHQIALHPSLQLNKDKRSFSGDIVKYKSLIQDLDDQYRLQYQQDQMPKIMIAQTISQPNLNGSNARRSSQINIFPRKKQKDNLLAQKFIVMRQQRKKKKQAKKLRRKSCTCHECGGPATAYQIKHNDMDIQTYMARKVQLANMVIQNFKSQANESKNLKLRKEKQLSVLKAALEKTFFEQSDNQGQNELKLSDSIQQFQQEQAKYERRERGNSKGRTNIRMTCIGDYSPDKNTPASKMTDQDYKERLTQTDLEYYKFNRNKSNYSRPQENIKKMRQTMIQYNIIESLINIHDESSQQISRKQMFKNNTLSMSLKNLNIPEKQSPEKLEKKQFPYKLQQRNSQNSILKQLPPKIILRKDLQNLFFKQSVPFEKLIDGIEQTAHEDTLKSQRFNLQAHSNRNIPKSSIDLNSTTQQFFQSVILQRQAKINVHSYSDLTLKSALTSSSSKYNTNIPSPTKLKNTPVKSNDKKFFHNQNGLEQHNLFFNKDQYTKPQIINPYTKNRMTPLRSRSPQVLPQFKFLSVSTQK